MGIITTLFKKIARGVKSLLGLKKQVTTTVERAVEIKNKIYDTIEIIDECQDQPLEVAKKIIPNLEIKLLLMVVVIFTSMYLIGLAAAVSGIVAWPILGVLLGLIVTLVIKSKEDNEEEVTCI